MPCKANSRQICPARNATSQTGQGWASPGVHLDGWDQPQPRCFGRINVRAQRRIALAPRLSRQAPGSYQCSILRGPVALTLPGARAKSEDSWDLSDLAHEPRRAAIVAAPAGVPLAAHLGAVDPAPVQRGRAEPRRDPLGV